MSQQVTRLVAAFGTSWLIWRLRRKSLEGIVCGKLHLDQVLNVTVLFGKPFAVLRSLQRILGLIALIGTHSLSHNKCEFNFMEDLFGVRRWDEYDYKCIVKKIGFIIKCVMERYLFD